MTAYSCRAGDAGSAGPCSGGACADHRGAPVDPAPGGQAGNDPASLGGSHFGPKIAAAARDRYSRINLGEFT